MKILFAITTGRDDFKGTLDLISRNFNFFNHFNNHEIGLAINYDCSFLGLSDADFVYNSKHAKIFNEIIYFGEKHVSDYIELMKSGGIDSKIAQILAQSIGYSNKKNLVSLEAIRRGYDIVLFWDDDEYPFICNTFDDKIFWAYSDILGAHVSAYKNFSADVAFGFFTGYASPIPLNLDKRLSKKTAKHLGSALSVASDVIDTKTFIKTDEIFKGVKNEHLLTKEIGLIDGGKWISGGNLSVSVKAIKNGIVPPYYAPPTTRADDTVLSMNLQKAKVFQIPAGIFHDAFGEYKCIRTNTFPDKIIREKNVSGDQVKRFCGALKGWFGYAPIFLRIRHGKEYKRYIQEMIAKTKLFDELLFKEMEEAKEIFDGLPSEVLKGYSDSVEDDFKIMHTCYEEWKKISKIKFK